ARRGGRAGHRRCRGRRRSHPRPRGSGPADRGLHQPGGQPVMSNHERILAYASALFEVARSEGNLAEVEDELFRFARTLEGSDELRSALTDPALPVSRRQQIVEDLLGGRANPLTTSLVSMVVG